tara:strand:+ start:882 stop:1178 length:297 start_codon:yes stop_codon:yes gene_type:complete
VNSTPSIDFYAKTCNNGPMQKNKFNDPCSIAIETDEALMAIHNPYVATLVEMGYDRADCEMVAAAGRPDPSYPRTIYGRTFDTKAEYDEALADYLNGM